MKSSKRLPAHSAKVAVRTMLNAAQSPIPCPDYVALREQDRPFWDAILRARARDEWTESDLAVGAQLARCRADIETESKRLEAESSVVVNQRGDLSVNPRITIVAELTRRETMLMRSLRMAGPTPIHDLNAQRGMQRAAEKLHAKLSSDEDRQSILN